MMRKLGIKDIRPMLELRKRQRTLNNNTKMRIQLLKNERERDMVVVRNRVWRCQETWAERNLLKLKLSQYFYLLDT